MTTNFPDDEDGAVLAELAAMGVDLSSELTVEFQVAAPDAPSAQSILKAILATGYEAELDYDEGEPDEDGVIDPDDEEFGPSWTIYSNVTMIPSHAELLRIQANFDEIAKPFGGKSDGWGVMSG